MFAQYSVIKRKASKQVKEMQALKLKHLCPTVFLSSINMLLK